MQPPFPPTSANPSIGHQLARRSLRVRQNVYVPLVFHKGQYITFKKKYLVFLDAWKPGMPMAHACDKAGITVQQATRFLAQKKVRGWLHDLAREAAIKNDWDRPEKWFAMANDWLEGKKKPCENAIEIWKELGSRVCPKPSRIAQEGAATNIQININPESVDLALERQKTIDAEIAAEFGENKVA